MTYAYDIFISYMHDAQMEGWIHNHLLPFINTFVGNALNRPAVVFVDRERISSGDSWPLKLQEAIAKSRCLVPIWSPLYFHSEWCRRECAAMFYRELKTGFRTIAKPQGLVVPINVYDGEFFPPKARNIQWIDCQRFWLVGEGFSKTERYIEFQDVLRAWSSDVASVIYNAPEWQHYWLTYDWLDIDDRDLIPVSARNFKFPGLE
jgi:hypothetical protein